jgi:uroporphyrinogen-III synthase
VSWPTLRFETLEDPSELRAAATRLTDYDWVVFTSARAVHALSACSGIETGATRVAVVGPATADAARASAWQVDLCGTEGSAALAHQLGEQYGLAGVRVLFPAASLAEKTLERELRDRGAVVERVEAYRTIPMEPDWVRIEKDLRAGLDVVTFASPSAVRALAQALGTKWPAAFRGTRVTAIGPTTARALSQTGVEAVTVAPTATVDGLVEACVRLMHPH